MFGCILTVHALRNAILGEVVSHNLITNLWLAGTRDMRKVIRSLISTGTNAYFGTVVLRKGWSGAVSESDEFRAEVGVVVVGWVVWDGELSFVGGA